jgi:nucleotide-binding universal stress UspA family protein
VVVGDDVPEWVLRWCARSAREVRRRCVPGSPAEPTSAERVRAIADIAADAARRGCAVLVLPAVRQARGDPARVVAAVRHLPDDAHTLSDAAATAGCTGADLVVAHGLPSSFGEHSVGMQSAAEDAARVLDAAVQAVALLAPGLPVRPWLARVLPHELVGEQLDADLLVMGGPRAERPAQLGLVARSALFHAPCPVLLTPRPARPSPEPWAPGPRGEASTVRTVGGRP